MYFVHYSTKTTSKNVRLRKCTLFSLFLEPKQLLAKRHILIKIIFFPNQYFLPLGYYFLEGFSTFFLSKLAHVVYEKSSALPYTAYIKSSLYYLLLGDRACLYPLWFGKIKS